MSELPYSISSGWIVLISRLCVANTIRGLLACLNNSLTIFFVLSTSSTLWNTHGSAHIYSPVLVDCFLSYKPTLCIGSLYFCCYDPTCCSFSSSSSSLIKVSIGAVALYTRINYEVWSTKKIYGILIFTHLLCQEDSCIRSVLEIWLDYDSCSGAGHRSGRQM